MFTETPGYHILSFPNQQRKSFPISNKSTPIRTSIQSTIPTSLFNPIKKPRIIQVRKIRPPSSRLRQRWLFPNLHSASRSKRTTSTRLQSRPRHRKHRPRNLLRLLLRPPTHLPYLAKRLQTPESQTNPISSSIPFRACEDIGTGAEVGEG